MADKKELNSADMEKVSGGEDVTTAVDETSKTAQPATPDTPSTPGTPTIRQSTTGDKNALQNNVYGNNVQTEVNIG